MPAGHSAERGNSVCVSSAGGAGQFQLIGWVAAAHSPLAPDEWVLSYPAQRVLWRIVFSDGKGTRSQTPTVRRGQRQVFCPKRRVDTRPIAGEFFLRRIGPRPALPALLVKRCAIAHSHPRRPPHSRPDLRLASLIW